MAATLDDVVAELKKLNKKQNKQLPDNEATSTEV